MNVPIRPPPKVLILHDGTPVDTYLSFLRAAGFEADKANATDAVAQAAAIQPDIIVLDFACDGTPWRPSAQTSARAGFR